jgi:hypothetical protein
MDIEYSERQSNKPKFPTSVFARHSVIYPNWDFGFENVPSGNPGTLFVQMFFISLFVFLALIRYPRNDL